EKTVKASVLKLKPSTFSRSLISRSQYLVSYFRIAIGVSLSLSLSVVEFKKVEEEMITRSKLVEQLRDFQIRSQHKCPALTVFSPKPFLSSRVDVAVAIFWATLFSMLVVSSYVTFYLRHFWLSLFILGLSILLPIRLRSFRQAVARKRERRLLLPLSM
ncbi:hypothetical protein CISIN_1g041052mg, partial [Citrus sinensis]